MKILIALKRTLFRATTLFSYFAIPDQLYITYTSSIHWPLKALKHEWLAQIDIFFFK